MVVYELRGALEFLLSRKCCCGSSEDEPVANNHIVLDLTNISLIHDVGVRMLFEGVDRLIADGHRVAVIDSRASLGRSRSHAGHEVVVREELSQYLQQFEG